MYLKQCKILDIAHSIFIFDFKKTHLILVCIQVYLEGFKETKNREPYEKQLSSVISPKLKIFRKLNFLGKCGRNNIFFLHIGSII